MAYITINENNKLNIPDNPNIGYIEGDGIGPDITNTMITVVNASLEIAYSGRRSIIWEKVAAGEEAFETTGKHLPQESL
ncbi:MAG: isocitrate/isopropylmalate family dehydrogenase, partial [Thermoplasmataceae archaeon]